MHRLMKNVSQHLLHLMHYRKCFLFQHAMNFNHIPAKFCMNAWGIFLSSSFFFNSVSMLGKSIYKKLSFEPAKHSSHHNVSWIIPSTFLTLTLSVRNYEITQPEFNLQLQKRSLWNAGVPWPELIQNHL